MKKIVAMLVAATVSAGVMTSTASADGYETYCCEHCRKAAEAQYYGYFLQDSELGKRFNTFRQMLPSQGNIAETFHGAAADERRAEVQNGS